MKRVVVAAAAAAVVVAVVAGTVVACGACASLPKGAAGADADALAHKVEAWVNKDAWDKQPVVKFTFLGKHEWLWDKQRGLVEMKDGDDVVFLDLWDRGGFAFKSGVEVVDDADRRKKLDAAWASYCNDTFWLNPLVKLFDGGTTRELVPADADAEGSGKRALKISYASGGVTPGDSYVWMIDDDGRPTGVRMWVSALPIKGITFTWDGWTTLQPSGAKVAGSHGSLNIEHAVEIKDIAGFDSAVAAAAGENAPDPFARLVERRGKHG